MEKRRTGESSTPISKRGRLVIDDEHFATVERLLAYEIGSQVLGVHLALQRQFGLRAEVLQVLLVIMLASIQRYIRAPNPDPAYRDSTPLPDELSGQISRRRIADVLGIPLETVRRHVELLICRDFVIEPSRGHLTTPPGMLVLLSEAGIPRSAAARTIALSNMMLRHEAAQIEDYLPKDEAFAVQE